MTACSTPGCENQALYKATGECRACYHYRRYHEDPEFRRKKIDSSVASTRRRRHKEAQELRQLRAYREAVEAVIEDWEGQRHARDYAGQLRYATGGPHADR